MNMTRFQRMRLATIACVLTTMAAAPPALLASTYEPSGINLGGTSFMDGFGPGSPGFTYIGWLKFRDNDHVNDANGDANPLLKNPSIKTQVMLNQLVYTTPWQLWDGHVGFLGVLPVLKLDASTAAVSPVQLHSRSGVTTGDLTVAVFLQMDPVISGGRPVFSQRFEFSVMAPTGGYDKRYSVNPGANFWSINPYWAMTFLPTPNTEASLRLHYLYNYKNSDPAGVPPNVRNFQAGQAFWANYAASYKVLPELNVGLNGYYFRQISDDKENGVRVDGTRTTDLVIGPGAMWKVDQHNILTANWYLPVRERNSTSGSFVNLRWVHGF